MKWQIYRYNIKLFFIFYLFLNASNSNQSLISNYRNSYKYNNINKNNGKNNVEMNSDNYAN